MTDSELERARGKRQPGLRNALLAGVLLWLSCPVLSLWPLAWIAVAPLIRSVTTASRFRQAFCRGYLFGWVYLGSVWYWTGLTIVAWTHSEIGWLAWFGLTLLLALFYGAYGGVAWWLARKTKGWGRVIALSAAWVVMEWMRTLGRLTMPWAQIGYSQYRCLPVIQIAAVTGALGVSFLVMLVNSAAAEWLRDRADPKGPRCVVLACGVTVAICLFGAIRIRTREKGPEIYVASMQPNFRANGELNAMQALSVVSSLSDTAAAASRGIMLFVWPESATPFDAMHDYRTYNELRSISERYQAAIAIGSRVIDPRTRAEFNSAVLITDDGAAPQRYDKRQLVPFGEFIPYRDSLPSVLDANFQFPPTDVVSGTGEAPLTFTTTQGVHVALGPFICYESMYPPYAREMTRAGANLLITESNDDWFQSESAFEQHLSAVVLRAVENSRYVVRSTSTGITCIIDPQGRIVGELPVHEPGYLIRKVQLLNSRTIYNRFGDWFVLLCGVYLAAILIRNFGNRRSPVNTSQPAGREE